MRIIGGTHKGRRFIAPKSIPARPTTDYAKEGIFNILQHTVEFDNTKALDLFCGIGGLSFELASRGAVSVVSIDRSGKSISWIKQMSNQWNMPINALKYDAIKWLERCDDKFGLILADPPFDYDGYDSLINLVLKNALETNGIFVLEHRQSNKFATHPNLIDRRRYGEVEFSIFKSNHEQ